MSAYSPLTNMMYMPWRAISAETGATAWTYEQRAATESLAITAAGLVFVGEVNDRFRGPQRRDGRGAVGGGAHFGRRIQHAIGPDGLARTERPRARAARGCAGGRPSRPIATGARIGPANSPPSWVTSTALGTETS